MGDTDAQVLNTLPPIDVEEENGYDAPFATFTWARWQEMQAQIIQRFTRFQRAIEHKQTRVAMQLVLEMQQVTMEWLREASEWIDVD